MKVELSIKVDYLPNWSLMEGVREIIQNAKDAQTEYGAKMSVHVTAGNVLVIENDGATLPLEALLLGHTSKMTRSDLIGQFGEGLKLGVLALLREGHTVRIRNGSEVWVPSISWSEKFNAKVLAFNILKGKKDERRVRFEISNVTKEDWETRLRKHFLFLNPISQFDSVTTDRGTLITAPDLKGNIYVKGILVENRANLSYAYDLAHVSVDRDRKMVDNYELEVSMAGIWKEATAKNPKLASNFNDMLTQNSDDIASLADWRVDYLGETLIEQAAAKFTETHGPGVVPVANLADCEELEHLGAKGVVVPRTLHHVLKRKLGSVEEVKAKLRTEVVKTFSREELTDQEWANLKFCTNILSKISDFDFSKVDVVDFRSNNLEGLFNGTHIRIAKKFLCVRWKTLQILVHEHSHYAGRDGSKGHVGTIEDTWMNLVAQAYGEDSCVH